MTRLKIIATAFDDTLTPTRAEVRPDEDEHHDNPTPPEFASTSHQPISDCRRFIAGQSNATLSRIVYI